MNVSEQAKPFEVTKREVFLAWKRIKKNKGSAGCDGESLGEFEANLSSNLYKLWNRMSSGSYFPKAVKRVEIPKKDGQKRPLGIPTVYDRVAQEVVRARLEQELEPCFHPDSYGYRAGKTAHEAVGVCRKRAWKLPWVVDVNIEKFFDTIDHELLLRAVRKHCSERWIVLYVERWLKAPIHHEDGRVENPNKGTPQGGVVSPLLANLYLHYAFDMWMVREYPTVPFERYADDIVLHCCTEAQAQKVKESLSARLAECGLRLHPSKSKIVYCSDSLRPGDYTNVSFSFLGFTFKPRLMVSKRGNKFVGFNPAVSTASKKAFRASIRAIKLSRTEYMDIGELANLLNPKLRGWYNYFKAFGKYALSQISFWLDCCLSRWLRGKHRINTSEATKRLYRLKDAHPTFFAHWCV